MGHIVRYLLVIFCLFLSADMSGQPWEAPESPTPPPANMGPSTIRRILITGQRRTRTYIIERELTLAEGRSYDVADIVSEIRTSRQNLMNTALFVDVSVTPCNWVGDSLDIAVDVKERWYWWPFLYVKPIDRNWNVWIDQYGLSLDRVNYGLKLKGDNVTGRNDKLNIWLLKGYTEQVTVKYFNPFADRSLRHGYGFEVSESRNREVNYSTSANRQQFFKDDAKFLRRQGHAALTYSYRKGSVDRHTARLGIWWDRIDDTIRAMNPGFFRNGLDRVTYPELQYSYQHFDVDYIPYPLKGRTVEFNFLKRGLGGPMDLWQFDLKVARHWTLPLRSYFSTMVDATVKLPFRQSFVNQPFLGYSDDFLRGLEYYVVDGVAGGYMRNTLRKEIGRIDLRTGLRSRTYAVIPFRFYAKLYGDAGYVHARDNIAGNTLSNRLLYSGGVGLDVLTIYDWVIRIEYSFNQLRENALFVHKFSQ
jgi:outer membrane protein assembly factor BamA